MRNVQAVLKVRREASPELMLDSGGEASDVRLVFVLATAQLRNPIHLAVTIRMQ
jgi:hypothetical protein